MNPKDVNYKYYLGENYLKEFKDPARYGGQVSTMVCNHCSFMDIVVLTKVFGGHVAYVAG